MLHDPRFIADVRSKVRTAQSNLRHLTVRHMLLIAGGLILLAAILFRLFTINSTGGGGFNRGGMMAPVSVANIIVKDVSVTEKTIGTVLAASTVQINSQVSGQLMSAAFKEGDLVKEGQVLFQIDQRPYAAVLRQAEAALARDKAQLASAQSNETRQNSLAAIGGTSTQNQEAASAQAKATAATVAADQAAVDKARLDFNNTTIRAPVDGKTGPILIQPGNLVRANDVNPMVVIQQVQPVKITFNLPQSDLTLLQDRMSEGGLVATMTPRKRTSGDLPALTSAASAQSAIAAGDGAGAKLPDSGASFQGTVDFIGNAVDNKAGTIELRVTLPNPDLRLVPNELVDVSLVLDTLKQVPAVPREAVNVGPNGNYVWVVNEENRANMVPVNVLFDDGTTAALASSELKAGQKVITDGQLRINPGGLVAIAGADGLASPPQGGPGGGGWNGQRNNRNGKPGDAAQGNRPQGAPGAQGAGGFNKGN